MTLSRKELIERMARALYECERERAENATEVMETATGRNCPSMAMEPWDECFECFLSDATAALSILDQAGMVIVPREPSEAMLNYAAGSRHTRLVAKAHYQAMIEAALTDQQI